MEWDDSKQEYQVFEEPRANEVAVYPVRKQDGVSVEKRWHRGHQVVEETPSEYRVRRIAKSNGDEDDISIDFKIRIDMKAMPRTWWDDRRYASANLGAKALKEMFGEKDFDFAKATGLVEDCLRASLCVAHSIVLDYFAGSGTTGHAVIKLNREDGGQRKFILVEMGEYFDTLLLPRIKKVTYSPEWRGGRPKRAATLEEAERSPRIVKYMRLESYEDALDGIGFDEDAGRLDLDQRIDGYLLKYMLKWETKAERDAAQRGEADAAVRLPAAHSRQWGDAGANGGRGRDVQLPAWAERSARGGCATTTAGATSFTAGRRERPPGTALPSSGVRLRAGHRRTSRGTGGSVDEQKLVVEGDMIYVNGDSCIPGAKAVEPVFKARMFAAVNS